MADLRIERLKADLAEVNRRLDAVRALAEKPFETTHITQNGMRLEMDGIPLLVVEVDTMMNRLRAISDAADGVKRDG